MVGAEILLWCKLHQRQSNKEGILLPQAATGPGTHVKKQNLWVSRLSRNSYVSLWDPESTKLQCYLGPSPCDLRIIIHWNVVQIIFHMVHISPGWCKFIRTTFQCIVVLQWRGEGPENQSQIYPISPQVFWTFSPQFKSNNTLKCSSHNFA